MVEISGLYIYPVKSLRGVAVDAVELRVGDGVSIVETRDARSAGDG